MKTKIVVLIVLLVLCGVVSMFLFGNRSSKGKVGISMPSHLDRWQKEGAIIHDQLKDMNYEAILAYADENVERQKTQLKEMIENGCKCLIVTPVDAFALQEVMELAKSKKVDVISYDRLIMNSDAVTGYVTFDSLHTGDLMAWFILNKLKPSRENVCTLEIFCGDSKDSNTPYLYQGAMKRLTPYLEDKSLVIRSGQQSIADTAIEHWSQDNARKRMEELLAKYYTKEPPNAVLVMNDSMARGVLAALEASGCKEQLPIITGQDCDLENVKLIMERKQYLSVFKDVRVLAEQAAMMADAVMSKKEMPVNYPMGINNGAIDVPTYLNKPVAVTRSHVKKLLVDSGYYEEKEVKK